jgi:hypothetical protein
MLVFRSHPVSFSRLAPAYAACESDNDNEDLMNQLCDIHFDALKALVEAVDAKDSPSLADVLEFARANRSSYEDGEVEGYTYRGESSSDIEHALVRAVLKMGAIQT